MEHIAQSNQYFLVTVGIALRNKPSPINPTENLSQTLTSPWEDSAQREEGVYVLRVMGVSPCLLISAFTSDDFDN